MIKSVTVQDAVYEKILKDIGSGKMAPGYRFTMESIAKDLQVSIMPVREALMRLKECNLIKVESNRKIVVNELTVENLRSILEARLLNECYLVEKASLMRSEQSIRKIEKIHEEIVQTEGIEEYLILNRNFHFSIYNEAASPVIVNLIKPLWDRVYPYLHILFRDDPSWNDPKWRNNHEGMLEGMKKREPKLIRKWLETDLTEAAEQVGQMLSLK